MISELQTDTYGSYPTLQVGFGIHRCLHKCCTFLIFKIDVSALHIAELCFVIRLSKVPKEPSHGAVADKPFPLLHVMPREHMSLPTSKDMLRSRRLGCKSRTFGLILLSGVRLDVVVTASCLLVKSLLVLWTSCTFKVAGLGWSVAHVNVSFCSMKAQERGASEGRDCEVELKKD